MVGRLGGFGLRSPPAIAGKIFSDGLPCRIPVSTLFYSPNDTGATQLPPAAWGQPANLDSRGERNKLVQRRLDGPCHFSSVGHGASEFAYALCAWHMLLSDSCFLPFVDVTI